MKCQILFSGKSKKKYILVCCLLKYLPRVLSVKRQSNCVTAKNSIVTQISWFLVSEKQTEGFF